MPEQAIPVQANATIIEVRPFRGGWQCFEAPGVQPTGLAAEKLFLAPRPRPTRARGGWMDAGGSQPFVSEVPGGAYPSPQGGAKGILFSVAVTLVLPPSDKLNR
jgi:hypothetical protein